MGIRHRAKGKGRRAISNKQKAKKRKEGKNVTKRLNALTAKGNGHKAKGKS